MINECIYDSCVVHAFSCSCVVHAFSCFLNPWACPHSQLTLSLQKLGRLSRPIAEAIAAEAAYRMPSLAFKPFEPADYVGVTQGFARACEASAEEATSGEGKAEDMRDIGIPLLTAMAAHLAAGGGQQQVLPAGQRLQLPCGVERWKPEHLSQLAGAYATAGVRHDGLFLGPLKQAAVDGPRGLSQFHPWALDEIKDAYRRLGYKEAWL